MCVSVLMTLFLVGLTHAQLPNGYMAMTAAQKLDVVWNLILAGKYTSDPLPVSKVPDEQIFNSTFLQGSFGQELEEMPEGRPKLVGTNGITARASFIIYPNSTYTGVFKASANNSIIVRYSSNTANNLVSYVALKVFIDGSHSQNFHLLHDTIGWGQPNINHFQWSQQTVTPEALPNDYATGLYSVQLNQTFTDAVAGLPGGPLHRPGNIWGLGSVEQSQIDNKGVQPDKVAAPWIIQITPQVGAAYMNIQKDDWRKVVTRAVPANTLLFKVTARRSPCDDYDTIGEIWTRSEFVASSYHDKTMRFGQPYLQWDYSVAAPGTYCSTNPNDLTKWPQDEADLMEAEAVNPNVNASYPAQTNSPAAIAGAVNPAGIGEAAATAA